MRCSACLLLFLAATSVWAGHLQPRGWIVEPVTAAAVLDGDLSTDWQSAGPQRPGLRVTIDFGKPLLLHRVVLHTGGNLSGFARGVAVQSGDDPAALRSVATAETLNEVDLDLRFNPVVGRYCRLQLTTSAGYPWHLAEVELRRPREVLALGRRVQPLDAQAIQDLVTAVQQSARRGPHDPHRATGLADDVPLVAQALERCPFPGRRRRV